MLGRAVGRMDRVRWQATCECTLVPVVHGSSFSPGPQLLLLPTNGGFPSSYFSCRIRAFYTRWHVSRLSPRREIDEMLRLTFLSLSFTGDNHLQKLVTSYFTDR